MNGFGERLSQPSPSFVYSKAKMEVQVWQRYKQAAQTCALCIPCVWFQLSQWEGPGNLHSERVLELLAATSTARSAWEDQEQYVLTWMDSKQLFSPLPSPSLTWSLWRGQVRPGHLVTQT